MATTGPGGRPRTPLWVKISGIVGALVVVLVIAVLVMGAMGIDNIGGHDVGRHGPGQHAGNDASAETGSCAAEPIAHGGGSGASVVCTDVEGAGTESQTFTCRNPHRMSLQVDRQAERGQFTVTLKDGAGAAAFSKTYSGQGGDDAEIRGQDGTWTIEVKRTEQFSGSFAVRIYCSMGDH